MHKLLARCYSCAAVLASVLMGPTLQADEMTVRLTVDGRSIEGMPLARSSRQMYLLGRDGTLFDFQPSQARDVRKTSDRFYRYSPAEMRAALHREFGKHFDVSGTGHYLVVHPAGQRDRWSSRFEELYRSFVHYFSSRGLRVDEPTFPLVAVVFPNRNDFVRFAARGGVNISPGLLGYYSPRSNRILLYDITAGQSRGNWHVNAETIIHEATHQSAFNTGIHKRFGATPRWVAEGLGTMFEARGVWNSVQYTGRANRINRERLIGFREYANSRRPAGAISRLIANDDLFRSDPQAAYAEAWALTFFLAELEPRKYWQYLKRTAGGKPFTGKNSAQRMHDFTDIFSTEWQLLDVRMLRFIQSL